MRFVTDAVRLYFALVESEATVTPATLWSWDAVREAIKHDQDLLIDLGRMDEASRERVLRYTGAFEPLESLGRLYVFPDAGAATGFMGVAEDMEALAEPYTDTVVHVSGPDMDALEVEAVNRGGVPWKGPRIADSVKQIDASLPHDMLAEGIHTPTVRDIVLRAAKAPAGLLQEGEDVVGNGPERKFEGRLRNFCAPRSVAGVPSQVTEALRVGGFLSAEMHRSLLEQGEEEKTTTSTAPADQGGVADTEPAPEGGAAQSQSEPAQEPEKPTEHVPTEEEGAPDGDVTLPDGTVVPKEVLQQAFVKFLDRVKEKLQAGTEAGKPPARDTDDREMAQERPGPGEQETPEMQPAGRQQQQQAPTQAPQAPVQQRKESVDVQEAVGKSFGRLPVGAVFQWAGAAEEDMMAHAGHMPSLPFDIGAGVWGKTGRHRAAMIFPGMRVAAVESTVSPDMQTRPVDMDIFRRFRGAIDAFQAAHPMGESVSDRHGLDEGTDDLHFYINRIGELGEAEIEDMVMEVIRGFSPRGSAPNVFQLPDDALEKYLRRMSPGVRVKVESEVERIADDFGVLESMCAPSTAARRGGPRQVDETDRTVPFDAAKRIAAGWIKEASTFARQAAQDLDVTTPNATGAATVYRHLLELADRCDKVAREVERFRLPVAGMTSAPPEPYRRPHRTGQDYVHSASGYANKAASALRHIAFATEDEDKAAGDRVFNLVIKVQNLSDRLGTYGSDWHRFMISPPATAWPSYYRERHQRAPDELIEGEITPADIQRWVKDTMRSVDMILRKPGVKPYEISHAQGYLQDLGASLNRLRDEPNWYALRRAVDAASRALDAKYAETEAALGIGEAVKVDKSRFVNTHGRNPSGYGTWGFGFDGDTSWDNLFWVSGADFKTAVKQARAEAKARGADRVVVMERVSIERYIPAVLPRGLPHAATPVDEGTTGRVIGVEGRRLIVESGGRRMTCPPGRVLALAEGYDTDSALLDIEAGADVMAVARRRLHANMGLSMREALKGGGGDVGSWDEMLQAPYGATIRTVAVTARGEVRPVPAMYEGRMQRPPFRGEYYTWRDIKDAAATAIYDAAGYHSPSRFKELHRAWLDWADQAEGDDTWVVADAVAQAVHDALNPYAVDYGLFSASHMQTAADMAPEVALRVARAGWRWDKATLKRYADAELPKFLRESSGYVAVASASRPVPADTSPTPTMTAPQHTGAAEGTGDEERNPGNLPSATAGKKKDAGAHGIRMAEAYRYEREIRAIPGRELRDRLYDAGHTRLNDIADYDLWSYAVAMIDQGDLSPEEIGIREDAGAHGIGIGERGEYYLQSYDPRYGWVADPVVGGTTPTFRTEREAFAEISRRKAGGLGGKWRVVRYAPGGVMQVGDVVEHLERAGRRLLEQLDTGEDAEREAAAKGFVDAAEQLKKLRQAAFQLTTDDLVRLTSLMQALGNKGAADKVEKLRTSLANLGDIVKKAGDALKKAHGAAGVGEVLGAEQQEQPQRQQQMPQQQAAQQQGQQATQQQAQAQQPQQAPQPQAQQQQQAQQPAESVVEADLGGFKKAKWVAKTSGPFRYGQVVWVLPPVAEGEREVWVAEDPHTRRGIYADRAMVEVIEREYRDETADTMMEVAILRVLDSEIPGRINEGENFDTLASSIRGVCADLGLHPSQIAEVHRVASHGGGLVMRTVSVDSAAHDLMAGVDDPVVGRLVMDTEDGMVARVPGATLMEVARVMRKGSDPQMWRVADILESAIQEQAESYTIRFPDSVRAQRFMDEASAAGLRFYTEGRPTDVLHLVLPDDAQAYRHGNTKAVLDVAREMGGRVV